MSSLFREMLYVGYDDIFGHTDFWDSKRRGSRFSNDYSLLSKLDVADLFGKSKREQREFLKRLVAKKKYSSKLASATNFIKKVNSHVAQLENGEQISANDILKKINEFFNMPLASGGGQGFDDITPEEEAAALEIERMINAMGSQYSQKGSVRVELIERLSQLLQKAKIFSASSSDSINKSYGSIKGVEVERQIHEFLNRTSWAKTIHTGNLSINNSQIGEDIVVVNDINQALENLANEINGSSTSIITINEAQYAALKAAELFSIQVKSGVKQGIINKDNALYSINLNQLKKIKEITMLQQLREWDSTQNKVTDNDGSKKDTLGTKYKNLNKSKTQQAGYFQLWPKSETLRAVATYALSKTNNLIQTFYRFDEYQVYWVLPYGFITLTDYLEKTKYYWQFTKDKVGFDFTPTFMTNQRKVSLRDTI